MRAFLIVRALAGFDVIGKLMMDPERYLIANKTSVLDCSKTKRDLDWEPLDDNTFMSLVAYRNYKARNSPPNE